MDEYRRDKSRWEELRFNPAQDGERGDYDRNEQARLRVVLQMQYDRTADDHELLRFIFEQEVLARENDSFQGIGTTLELGAFLLARFKVPEDVALFIRAKLANFDTACGFSREYAFLALRDKTGGFLRKHHPELANRLGSLDVPEGLDGWWQHLQKSYPDAEDKEELLARYERYIQLGDLEKAKYVIDLWSEREPDSEGKWSQLRHNYAELGDYRRAATYAQKRVAHADGSWDIASALSSLADLWHQAGDYDEALATLRKLDAIFNGFDGWIGVGLGRIAIHRAYEIAADHPISDSGREAFDIADRWFIRSRDIALVGLEAGVKAAHRCGLSKRADELQELATAECLRIDDMLSG